MIHYFGSSTMPLDRAAAADSDGGVSRPGDPLFMASFARGLLVIRAFSGLRRRRTIAEISRATGLSRAAVRRCLYTLCQLGYARCEDRRYGLLPKVLGISHGALLPRDLAAASAPRASPAVRTHQNASGGSAP